MKIHFIYWVYTDGSVWQRTNEGWRIMFGCENHKEERYHLSESQAKRKVKEYCKRLSVPRKEKWLEEKFPSYALFA